jgi:hypothetical protein
VYFANGTASPSAASLMVSTADQSALGSYCSGANKESYSRAGWEEAYGAALIASIKWIDAFEAMAGANATALAQLPLTFRDDSIAPSVTSDVYYGYRLTLWYDTAL